MAQAELGILTPAETSGTELATRLRNFEDALHTLHSGNVRPSYAVAGTLWLNTASDPWRLMLFTGGDDIEIMGVSVANQSTTLNKSSLGLGNVNNTSDAAKPISTATQAALNQKATIGSSTNFGGLEIGNTVISGDTMRIAVNRTGNGNSLLDFFTTGTSTPDSRILANQSANLLQFQGYNIRFDVGNIHLYHASPTFDITRTGVGVWRQHVYSDNRWALTDSNHNDKLRVYPDGAIWTSQLGDLNSRIEGRARAFAEDRVSNINFRRTGTAGVSAQGGGNKVTPAGTVMIGIGNRESSPNDLLTLLYTTLQIFDPVNGWRTIQG